MLSLTLACAFLACTQPLLTSPDAGPMLAPTAADIRLTYICGNSFRLRNSSADTVTVRYDVYGTTETGPVFLPGKPTGASYSETYLTTVKKETVRVFLGTQLVQTKANGNLPQCQIPSQRPPAIPSGFSWSRGDSVPRVTSPGDSRAEFFRRLLLLEIDTTVSGSAFTALLLKYSATVVGGFPEAKYYVITIPDPGTYDSLINLVTHLRAEPGIVTALGTEYGNLVADPLGHYPPTAADIRLTYICGKSFRLRNSSADTITVRYDVYGTTETGPVFLPGKPTGALYSETYFTTVKKGTVRVFLGTRLVQTKANGNVPVCAVATPFPQTVPDSIPVWVFADSNLVHDDTLVSGIYPRGILVVSFTTSSSTAQRGQLVASIGAEVVGGRPGVVTRGGKTSDLYLLRLRSDRSSSVMKEAVRRLLASSIVENAGFDFQVAPLNRRPADWLGRKRSRVDGTPSTHPSAQVPATAPDSIDDALLDSLYAPSNMARDGKRVTEIPQNAIMVRFLEGATVAQKQSAIAAISGVVVGGIALDEDGYYLVKFRGDRTVGRVIRVIRSVEAMPGVDHATTLARQGFEQVDVPAVAPDSVPSWVFADTNVAINPDFGTQRIPRNVVMVSFIDGATPAAKQAAFDSVAGVLIGGDRVGGASGFYYLRVPSDRSGEGLFPALAKLRSLPQVSGAGVLGVTLSPQ